jgi:glycine cleavage system H protein
MAEVNPPSDRRYSDTHEWCRLEGDIATVGITDFAAGELTDITHVDVQLRVGGTIGKGDKFGEIESVKAFSDLYSPVGGTVTAVNERLGDDANAGLVNSSPFDQGWMVKLRVADRAEYELLLDAAAYRKLVSGAAD